MPALTPKQSESPQATSNHEELLHPTKAIRCNRNSRGCKVQLLVCYSVNRDRVWACRELRKETTSWGDVDRYNRNSCPEILLLGKGNR